MMTYWIRLLARFVALPVVFALVAGCGGFRGGAYEVHVTGNSISHYTRDFTLSPLARTDADTGVTLVRIRADGAAVIRVKAEPGLHSAQPGDFYVGKQFGNEGLQLLSASRRLRTATFRLTWAQAD